ncbi:MAG: tRNA (N6-isopentenyl adenosine(37)-C2)-methylthiotransferase MiaB [Oscillospiraceae bacterium]|nr:tRNA (N6-isopentenyl adenosine(37)-C2)-methylthiotransferase MiaB [Oscillospiraceae bacterium]
MTDEKKQNWERFPSREACIEQVAELMSVRATGAEPLALVRTYGCQQNVADSEKLRGQLREMGFSFTENEEEADLILFNTCAVRENAEFRVYGNVGNLKGLKRKKPSLIIGVCGCMMEQAHVAEKIKQSYPYVNLVFGTHVVHKLPELLYQTLTSGKRVFARGDDSEDKTIVEGLPIHRDRDIRTWVTVMYGCDNFCSYCVVPYVRGRERSRTPQAIEEEVRSLIAAGYKEIVLLGQNVNSYGKTLEQPISFSALLRRLDQIPGDYRLRFMTSHPKDATKELIDTMAESKHICHSLHLPFQSGNDRILREMNRHYTREQYLSLIAYARQKMPDIAFSSDIIVGFPGETYEEFRDTVSLVEEVGFASLFTFIYSPRVGTRAADMEDPVPPKEKSRWFQELLDAQEATADRLTDTIVGTTQRVLVEEVSEKRGVLCGKTEGNLNCDFPGPESLVGQFVRVKITESRNWVLKGTLLTDTTDTKA